MQCKPWSSTARSNVCLDEALQSLAHNRNASYDKETWTLSNWYGLPHSSVGAVQTKFSTLISTLKCMFSHSQCDRLELFAQLLLLSLVLNYASVEGSAYLPCSEFFLGFPPQFANDLPGDVAI